MGIKAGEDTFYQAKRGIVQNGLVFNVDFGVKDCYSSGSTCSALSSNITGNLQNNPIFDKGKGGSIYFDGTDEYISFSHTGLSVGSDYSTFVWCKPDLYTSSPIILFNAGDSNDNRIFNFDVRNNLTLVGHKISNNNYWTQTSTPLNNNQWNLVGSTYGSSSLKLWLNNQNLSSRTQGSPTGPVDDRIWLGRWVGSTVYPFKGYVSQVLIYNRALTSDEVARNYNATRHRFGV
jgi:hypothetical protein